MKLKIITISLVLILIPLVVAGTGLDDDVAVEDSEDRVDDRDGEIPDSCIEWFDGCNTS